MHHREFLEHFVQQSRAILKDSLTGIYLHGSAAMGCFHPLTSDLDLLITVKHSISGEVKRRYMDMAVRLNEQAPGKGLEFSIVKEAVCTPFVYPTPFELHFSAAHLDWYRSDPEDYIEKMNGTDRDLAAHFTILFHRGETLYGKEIKEVFSEVDSAQYFDSIWHDIENAQTEIISNPVYVILNLCRVLAYKKDRKILSKQEGGEWGLANVPEKYRTLIAAAMAEYQTGHTIKTDAESAKEYAEYMLEQIRPKKGPA